MTDTLSALGSGMHDAAQRRAEATYDAYSDAIRSRLADPSTSPADRRALEAELRQLHTEFGELRSDGTGFATMEADRFTDAIEARHDEFIADRGNDWLGRSEILGHLADMTRVAQMEFVGIRPTDGEGLTRLMNADPGRFAEMWRDMDPDERQLAMFQMQQHASTEAQLTTLMTNMSQSAHQAAMAVARNLSA